MRVAELMTSAFYSDSLMLNEQDLAKLVLGHELEVGGLKIGYRHLPDNGCPCPNCRARMAETQPAKP
jgi:hypothetical protein